MYLSADREVGTHTCCEHDGRFHEKDRAENLPNYSLYRTKKDYRQSHQIEEVKLHLYYFGVSTIMNGYTYTTNVYVCAIFARHNYN